MGRGYLPRINKVILFFILLSGVHFFGLYFRVSEALYDVIDACYLGIAFILMLKYLIESKKYSIPRKHRIFYKPIIYLFICLFVSAISGQYYHDQFFVLALLAMRYFAYFIVYNILIMLGVQKDYLLKLVVGFALSYMVIFSLQLILFPIEIVPLGHVDGLDRGFLRVRLEGVGFVTLSAFYCLNSYLVDRKNKWNIVFYVLCFIYIYILGFRTLQVTFLLSSLLLVVVYQRSFLKFIYLSFATVIFVLMMSQVEVVHEYFNSVIELTVDQVNSGDDYIRFLTYDFLFNEVNIDMGSLLFGNSMPFEVSDYGRYVIGFGATTLGYISADLGLLGFIFNYGLLSLIAFLNIFRIAIFFNLGKENIYLNIFFFYLVISSFTTAEIYRAGMFVVEMIGLYIITYSRYKNIQNNIYTKNYENRNNYLS